MAESTLDKLRRSSNDYDDLINDYEHRVGPWRLAASSEHRPTRSIAVVIPARNLDYCLHDVLTGIFRAMIPECLDVVVVDDDSSDRTFECACNHPLRPLVVRLPQRMGRSVARNIGTILTSADTVLYLDGDMLISDITIR